MPKLPNQRAAIRQQPPVLRAPEDHRQATWLELFFDVVFVVSMAALAHNIEEHPSLAQFGFFAMTFLALWWLWMEYSYYADLFDTQGVLHQVQTLAAMFGVALMAVFIRSNDHDYSDDFAWVYVALNVNLLLMHGIAWYHIREWRRMTRVFLIAIGISTLLWIVSTQVATPLRYALMIGGVLVQMLAGPYIYLIQKDYPTQKSHMPERFGLFVIIVVGEGVAAVINGLDYVDWTQDAILTSVLAFGIVALVWKLYFYEAHHDSMDRALRGSDHQTALSFFYGYAHYFIYGSIALLGAGLLLAIEGYDEAPQQFIGNLIHGSLVVFLLSTTLSQWSTAASLKRQTVRARLVAAGLSAGLLTLPMANPLWLLGAQFGILFGQIFFEYYLNGFAYEPNEATQIG